MKNKTIKSQDGKHEVRYSDVTHVCIAPTLYPLLQYLLLMDDEVVFHHTYYFVNELIPENARKHFPHTFLDYFGKSFTQKIQRRMQKLRLRFLKYNDFPFLRTAEIFAYDLPYGSLCIGKRPYNLLPDAPNCLTLNSQFNSAEYLRMEKRANSFMGKVLRIIFGDLFVHYLGHNSQCKAIYLTEENTSPVLKGKEVYIQSLQNLWENASEDKKRFILNLFDISEEDVNIINGRPNLFFSQPLMKDCRLTESEYLGILSGIFQKYPKNSIIIKTHPRDQFDYAKHFPDVTVFTKSINSQLLYLIGIRPNKIITITSTAIEGFPPTIECDYYGSQIHPKLARFFGNTIEPKRPVNYIKNYDS